MRSPQMIGVAIAASWKLTFHLTFVCSSHFVGGSPRGSCTARLRTTPLMPILSR